MIIRKMRRIDLPQAAALERECFRASAWSEKAYGAALEDENALYLAAVEPAGQEEGQQDTLLGCCGIWQSFEDGEIMNVAVWPRYRRQGVADRMLDELMEQARGRGVENFTLEVRESNRPAIGLYESRGFVTEGVRKNFYDNPRENALIMWKKQKISNDLSIIR